MDRRIHYLFVDLGYLRDKYGGFAAKWFQGAGGIDFNAVYRHAHGPAKSFYYDCHETSRESAGLGGQDELFDRIRSVPGTHLRTGEPAGPHDEGRHKGVIVQLAVDMLQHATRGKMTHATLLSGDADFAPVVRALVDVGTDVTVWAEEDSVAPTLRMAADNFLPIQWHDYHHWTEERIGATALLPGVGSGVGSKLEGSRESYTRSGWTLLESGTIGEPAHRADLWTQEGADPPQYSLAMERTNGDEHAHILTLAHSDRTLLLRFAELEWGNVKLSAAPVPVAS